jgi:c-di-GMP-binding flagellar brake protein YcgR
MAHKLSGYTVKQSQKIMVSKNEKDKHEYTSSIEDINPRGIAITIPLHNQVAMSLRRGEEIYVKVPMPGWSLEFKSRVKSYKMENIPLIILEHPVETKRIQRRSAVRFKVLMDIKIAPLPENPKEEPLFADATAIDLSAGGMEMMTAARFEKNANVLVNFDLNMDKKTVYKFSVKSVVRRVAPLAKNKFKVGVEFLELSKAEQDRIFQYIFKKSAEKGM